MAVNIDANLEEADWTKQSWDLPFNPDSPEQAEWCAKQGITEEKFRQLPVYRWAKARQDAATQQ